MFGSATKGGDGLERATRIHSVLLVSSTLILFQHRLPPSSSVNSKQRESSIPNPHPPRRKASSFTPAIHAVTLPSMPPPRRKGRTATPAPRRDAASCKEQSTWKAFVSLALVVCALERATTKGVRFARMDTHAGVIALNANHESWRSPRGLREMAPTTFPPGHLL